MTTRICVYCGSRVGADPAFESAARKLGEVLVDREVDLVFGGGNVGLMGVVADTVLAGGRHVIGVTPEGLVDDEFPHPGIQDLRIVEDMSVRKNVMMTEADAFVALPGGVGTMEEMFEVLTWAYLGLHPKPVGMLNVNAYYDHLIAFLDHSVDVGLTRRAARDLLLVDEDPGRLVDRLLGATPLPPGTEPSPR